MIVRCLLLLGTASLFFMETSWALQGHDVNFAYSPISFDHSAIQYIEQPADDPVARLQRQMEKGEAELEFDPKRGYLPSVLENLGINIDSQVLVFSKTSFQPSRISPARPRVIYFNDSVSIAYVQNSRVLEVGFGWPKRLCQAHKPTARHIGDFSNWENPATYKRALEHLLQALDRQNEANQ